MFQKISIIVALAEDNSIGIKGKIPWQIPEDMKRFKELTMGRPVIMGRATFESILGRQKKPLEGRTNIVLTRNANYYSASGIRVAHSLNEALEIAGEVPEVFIIGGEQVYREALVQTDFMYLTEVSGTFPEADAHFPEFSRHIWTETWREDHNTLEEFKEPGLVYSFVNYERAK